MTKKLLDASEEGMDGRSSPKDENLLSYPAVNLILSLLCTYGFVICVFLCIEPKSTPGYFMAAGMMLLGASRFFQNFLKLKKKRKGKGPA